MSPATKSAWRLLPTLVWCAANASTSTAFEQAEIAAADLEFFEAKVRPVLVEHCYKCHSRDADKVKGGLLLDSREGLLHGGNTGDAVVPGDPEASLLIHAVRYSDEDLQMPPKNRKLSDEQIDDLTKWVQMGAPDPRSRVASGSSPKYGGFGKQHWAFQPVTKPPIPEVRDSDWCQSPIDRFVLAKLEAAELSPNPPADKHTLLRRVTFDLTGLPPSRDDMEAFLADNSSDAFARVVDRLLASRQYGEHWGRYWMDVARYADTKGDPARREDPRFPHAWTYRDYVIDAFNADKPYDVFIVEQLAADRLQVEEAGKVPTGKRPDQQRLAAMGFLTLGNQFNGRRHDIIDDQIDVTTKSFLGLTVSCARCHDHKFDPIPTEDYYSLYGIFANSVVPRELPTLEPVPNTPEVADYKARRAELIKEAGQLFRDFRDWRRNQNRDAEKRRELVRRQRRLQRELGDLESNHPGAPARANVLVDTSRPRNYPILIRGESGNIGEVVPRRFLEVISPDNRPVYRKGSGRLELAQAIASEDNPLTARVLVNRVWQQHFGEGFVSTPDDLGNMSSPPTHPELLDFLATSFVDDGWSIKKLHRQILLSSAYQVSSDKAGPGVEIDPDNHLLWRANTRRLDLEEIHDALLAMAGTLDTSSVGGKPIHISSEDFVRRRAVYTWIDRRSPPELFTQFDFPNPNTPSGRRYETIVPQQSLFLMNSPMVVETARALVQNPAFRALDSDTARVEALFLSIYQRPPSLEETDLCLAYVHDNPGGPSLDAPGETRMSRMASRVARRQAVAAKRAQASGGRARLEVEPGAAAFPERAPLDAWSKLAHALFQTNEAVFVD